MVQRQDTGAVGVDFAGAAYPVGSTVEFPGQDGSARRGKVTRLGRRGADVVDAAGQGWRVPYPAILRTLDGPRPECSLPQVADLGRQLIRRHTHQGGLSGQWTFGFDLAPARGGVCRFHDRRINLSVNYCLAATRAEVEDTILHEIAHAIVGPRHNHDEVWKAKALEIGCQGERCHRVQQSIPRWVGECGCGQQWFRQVLQRRIAHNRVCTRCRRSIKWRPNTQAAPA